MSKPINIEEQSSLGILKGWVYQIEGSDLWGMTPRSEQYRVEVEYETKEEAVKALDEWLCGHGGGIWTTPRGQHLVISYRTDEFIGDYSRCLASGKVAYYTTDGEKPMNTISWEITKTGEIEMNAASGLGSPLEAAAKSRAIDLAIEEAEWALYSQIDKEVDEQNAEVAR